MKSGIWKKYGTVDLVHQSSHESYDELFNDLKDSGKNWGIAYRYETCRNHLTGENQFKPGDIYVYYTEQNGKLVPEFYIKVMKYYNSQNKIEENMIVFNGASLGYDGIDDQYLPELIAKLREIDEEKNQKYIMNLEERYKNYQRLLFLQSKEKYTEEELLFIYLMAYRNKSTQALCLLAGRDIQKDFDSFSDENKANLFIEICDNPISGNLTITSKEVLLSIARKGSLKHLAHTSEELLADKDLILEVLKCFLETIKNLINFDLEECLPAQYQSDLDILNLIFEHLQMNSFTFWLWVQKNPELREKISDPDFSYQLMHYLVSSYIKAEVLYPRHANYLTTFPDELVDDIENHLLMGPEPTELRENLKTETLTLIQKEKQLVLVRRELKRSSKNV